MQRIPRFIRRIIQLAVTLVVWRIMTPIVLRHLGKLFMMVMFELTLLEDINLLILMVVSPFWVLMICSNIERYFNRKRAVEPEFHFEGPKHFRNSSIYAKPRQKNENQEMVETMDMIKR